MKYNISDDFEVIRELLDMTQEDLAKVLGVEFATINRTENGITYPSDRLIENFYNYVFSNNIHLNKVKQMLYKEESHNNEKLLFHGSKGEIIGNIDLMLCKKNSDFGQGFYCGEYYEQSASFIEKYPKSSVYVLKLDTTGLKSIKYEVNQDWMLTIAYFRGTLDEYADHLKIKKLIDKLKDIDYIIAPIADNRMFQIIDTFISGEITDDQCKHCLAATNLGYQYVMISEKAISNIKLITRLYLCNNERNYYSNMKMNDFKKGEVKVKLARIQYRGKGQYIDEILK